MARQLSFGGVLLAVFIGSTLAFAQSAPAPAGTDKAPSRCPDKS